MIIVLLGLYIYKNSVGDGGGLLIDYIFVVVLWVVGDIYIILKKKKNIFWHLLLSHYEYHTHRVELGFKKMWTHWLACVGILMMFVGFFYVFESKEMKMMNRNHPDKVSLSLSLFFFCESSTDETRNNVADQISISNYRNG